MRYDLCGIAAILFWTLAFPALATEIPEENRLQELLYGEALFLFQQQDYLAAISRLQMAEAQGLSPALSRDARVLLARLKLAYGMHLEAGFDLHALLGEDVPAPVRNGAWCELARAFSHRGHHQAAVEALANIQGELPPDMVGDCQLLQATVLMSLDRNREAAQVLATWRGAPELAAYAHYNRGIALVRAGDYQQVVPTLEMAVKMPARGEELLALRDKAWLALGYAFAREEDYKRARKQLQAVRPQGPFSNRALLALGWIDYKQGHTESAIASWTELRGRSHSDLAVLETLLVVPAVQRELDALQAATRDYEAAVAAYNDELNQVHVARNSIQNEETVAQLLQNRAPSGQHGAAKANQEATRFLGALLASRNFAEMQRSHGELQAMLENVDRGLQEIESLPVAGSTGDEAGPSSQPAVSNAPAVPESVPLQQQQNPAETPSAQWQRERIQVEGKVSEEPRAEIPQLPQIESPARRSVKPFPKRVAPSRPSISNYLRQPPSSEIIGLPGGEILRLPNSGEFFGRPSSGEFFRRPGEEEVEDYAYPDELPARRSKRDEGYAYQLNRLLAPNEQEPGFNAGAVPVGEALRELAAALDSTTRRMVELDPAYLGDAGLEQRLAALHDRILKLRLRIANAITLYEDYTRALALDELDRRQRLLEDLLEQARLELAKTYDRDSVR